MLAVFLFMTTSYAPPFDWNEIELHRAELRDVVAEVRKIHRDVDNWRADMQLLLNDVDNWRVDMQLLLNGKLSEIDEKLSVIENLNSDAKESSNAAYQYAMDARDADIEIQQAMSETMTEAEEGVANAIRYAHIAKEFAETASHGADIANQAAMMMETNMMTLHDTMQYSDLKKIERATASANVAQEAAIEAAENAELFAESARDSAFMTTSDVNEVRDHMYTAEEISSRHSATLSLPAMPPMLQQILWKNHKRLQKGLPRLPNKVQPSQQLRQKLPKPPQWNCTTQWIKHKVIFGYPRNTLTLQPMPP